MRKGFKTLEQHNIEAREMYHQIDDNTPTLNGIGCPECGKELLDSEPMSILTSNPPQKNVHCSNQHCDYVGYRIA